MLFSVSWLRVRELALDPRAGANHLARQNAKFRGSEDGVALLVQPIYNCWIMAQG